MSRLIDLGHTVEHMCHLGRLPDSGSRFHAVPVKMKHFGTFPVRAWVIVASSPEGD